MAAFALEQVRVAQTPVEKFEEFLRSRGMRITKPRRILVEEVFRRHEHFDVEELLIQLQGVSRDRSVSRPTVYRTLKELVAAGLLRELSLDGRRTVYEHDYGYPQHDHLHCEKCNKLIEFRSEEVAQIGEALAREYQFRVTGHRLIFTGICSECRAQPRPARKLDLI